MGQEVQCEVRFEGRVSVGKAQLETEDLIVRGEARLRIPLREIQSVDAADGQLRVTWQKGTAVFILGERAEKWAHRIRNPKTRADKLDVKPGVQVSLCGIHDETFRAELQARAGHIAEGKPVKDSDLIFLSVESTKDLARLKPLESKLKRNGAIWMVYPKGRKDITENHVREAGLAAGLVDVKVARFSETHTALKFVIPLAKR